MHGFISRLPRWLTIPIAILVILIIFGLMQLITIPADQLNPPVIKEPRWDSSRTRELARRACFDCHSNETTWPWYSKIAPFSWMIGQDVFGARSALNFSEWTSVPELEPGEIQTIVEAGEMPPGSYLLLHPEARLSVDEIKLLADGLSKSVNP